MTRVPSIKNVETKEERAKKKLEGITFEDIQKMHYSNLNQGKDEDAFNPQEFLDLDSGDSDNEILSSFKPNSKNQERMISLQQPPDSKYVPPYVNTNLTNIDEQTGYSNSPKFSVYRLNNNPSNFQNEVQAEFREYHAVNAPNGSLLGNSAGKNGQKKAVSNVHPKGNL